jgi:uncharacterized protein involved in exopolysaccharide biosynthesis
MAEKLTPREQIERILDLGRRSLRYTWLVAIITLVGGGLSVLLALSRPRQYESETVLYYREMISQSVLQGREVVQSSNQLSARFKEMLLARSNLVEVVKKFKLFPDVVESDGEVAAADLLRMRVSFRDKGAGTFRISYKGDTPEEAQKVTQFLGERLKQTDNELRREQAEVTKDFLQAEKKEADDELKERERTLAQFLTEHPEFAQEAPGGGSSSGAGIRAAQQKKSSAASSTESGLSALERQRRRIQARLANPDAPIPVAPRTAPAEPSEIKAARRDIEEAQRELQEKLAQFTDKHPDVLSARNRLASAQQTLRRLEAGLPAVSEESSAPLPVDRAALQRELTKVEREIASYRARGASSASAKSKVADDVVNLETEWSRLQRVVDESRERSSSLESRVFTADITASSEFADAAQLSVIDEAYLPHQPAGKPRRTLVMAGGLLFFGLGLGLALALALVDDRIYRRYDLQRLGIAPVLVVVPGDRGKGRRGKSGRRRRV